jgi:murein DD-endopeptidase MepM/ murein hydrolase activator NlpD
MVNHRRASKPAVVAASSWRERFRFRSPSVLVGGTALRAGGYTGHGTGGSGVGGGGELLGKLVRSARRMFPERQILVRAEGRVNYITLSRGAQTAMAASGLVLVALVACAIAGAFHVKGFGFDRAVGPAASLQAEIAQLKTELAAANAQLAQNGAAAQAQDKAAVDKAQARIAQLKAARDQALADEAQLKQQLAEAQQSADTRSQSLSQLNHTLDANRGALRQSDTQRQAMQNRIHQLEAELQSANARASQAKADLASNERRLQQLAAEHDKTLAERDRLQARLLQLQDGGSPLAPVVPAAPQRSIADRPSDQHSENVPPPGAGSSGELERVLASTGIDIEKLLGSLNSVPQGEGGPFIALDPKSLAARNARAKQLRKILATLPLAAPLVHYEIGSGFGPRLDPFNHREEFHPGVDLEAAYGSPVYSTAPGTVIFTGVKGAYGKVVEISHGHGIVTRYAHLHRILVVRGQKVGAHHVIGQLGSTGRSTGPHLHYEVLVDGTALDPEKFLQAGKNVVQADAH